MRNPSRYTPVPLVGISLRARRGRAGLRVGPSVRRGRSVPLERRNTLRCPKWWNEKRPASGNGGKG